MGIVEDIRMSDPVRDLIAKWRKSVAVSRAISKHTERDPALSLAWHEDAETQSACADELEAAVPVSAPPPTGAKNYNTRETLLHGRAQQAESDVARLTQRNIRLLEALDGLAERFVHAIRERERLRLKASAVPVSAPQDAWQVAALLNDRTRQAIRDRHRAGEPLDELANDYGVPVAFVTHLVAWQMCSDDGVPVSAPPQELACQREVMRSADDSAAYLSVPCTCGRCVAVPVSAAVPPQQEREDKK